MTAARYLTAGRVLQFVALALSIAACLLLLFVLRGASESVHTGPDGTTVTLSRPTLLESQGAGIILPLAVPILLCLIPLLVRGGRVWRIVSVVCVFALCGFVGLGALTVGAYYAPALGAAVIGLVLVYGKSRPARRPATATTAP